MAWAKIDDRFFAHPKVIDLSKDAKLLYLSGLTHCAAMLTDGLITPGALRAFAALVDVPRESVTELVTAGLWDIDGVNYRVHDYAFYNPSAADVTRKREATAQRQRDWQAKKQKQGAKSAGGEGNGSGNATNANYNGVTDDVINTAPVPVPVPLNTPIVPNESESSSFVPTGTEGDDFQNFDYAESEGGQNPLPFQEESGAEESTGEPGADTAAYHTPPCRRRENADEVYRALFAAFRRGKHPHWTEDRHAKIPESEFKQLRSALKSLHESGATPEQVEAATPQVRNLSWFKHEDQVTVPTVARYWTQLCDLAESASGKVRQGVMNRTLSDEWNAGDLVEVAPGIVAVATHPKDVLRPLSTLRFPGMRQSRHESIAGKASPEWNGRRVNLTGNKSDKPVPGWVCTDGFWYTLDESGKLVPCLADGSDPNAPVPAPQEAQPVRVPVRSFPDHASESKSHYSARGIAQC